MNDLLRHVTWTCQICGTERPDAAISVQRRAIQRDGRVLPLVTFNFRYCNDRPSCIEATAQLGPYEVGAGIDSK